MNDYDTPLKDNNCQMTFSCPDHTDIECVYYLDRQSQGGCEFVEYDNNGYYCRSTMAVANKMVIKLKKMGLYK